MPPPSAAAASSTHLLQPSTSPAPPCIVSNRRGRRIQLRGVRSSGRSNGPRSAQIVNARPVSLCASSISLSASTFLPAKATLAPIAMNLSAVARPIPLVAPVTRTRFEAMDSFAPATDAPMMHKASFTPALPRIVAVSPGSCSAEPSLGPLGLEGGAASWAGVPRKPRSSRGMISVLNPPSELDGLHGCGPPVSLLSARRGGISARQAQLVCKALATRGDTRPVGRLGAAPFG